MLIRPMQIADLDQVLEIAGGLSEAPHWAREVYEAAVNPSSAPRRVALVAEEDGMGIVGFAVASIVLSEAELETVGVRMEWQRRGLGRRFVTAICGRVAELGVTKVILEVRKSNATAQRLYRSYGFEEVGNRSSYYSDPKEDAIIMAFVQNG